MSTSGAPPNPGAGKGSPKGANPTALARYGTRILAGGLLIGTAYAYFALRPPAPTGTKKVNPLHTTGVQNIEGAYKSGGATATHTKAYGGTTQGNRNDEQLREGGGTGKPHGFDEQYMGENQRPSSPAAPMRKFKDMQYGTDTDK